MLPYMRGDGIFWVRLWDDGPGVVFKNKRKHPPLFSERHGYERWFYLGRWGFHFLGRDKRKES